MPSLRILVVEDDSQDFALLAEAVKEANSDVELTHVMRLSEALEKLDDAEAVLLDMGLPDSQGLDGLDAIRKADPSLPVIVLTGNDDDAVALKAIRAGAQDYLTKSRADARTVLRSLMFVTERTRLQAKAKEAKARASLQGIDAASSLDQLLQHVDEAFNDGPVVLISSIHGASRLRNQHINGPLTIIDATGMPGADGPDVSVEPTKLELLAVHAERATTRHGTATVIVHTVEGLSLYAGEDATVEFCQFLANRMRPLGVNVEFLMSDKAIDEELGRSVATYMDGVQA